MEGENYRPPLASTHRTIGWLLLGGLLLSIAVMIFGLIIAAARGTTATNVLPLNRIVPGLDAGQPAAILDLGILLLFATPLAGVIAALAGFISARDSAFTAVSAALLVMLLIAFAVALR